MIRPAVSAAAVLYAAALALSPAFAQLLPFDMEAEREAIGLPAEPPPADDAGELRGQILSEAPQADAAANRSALEIATPDGPHRRPILPSASLILAGESDSLSWAVYLTQAEAASAATLNVGFINALFVAPEMSALRFWVNDQPVIATAPNHAEQLSQITAEIPAGLLRPGANRIRFEADQRHRTDCTVASTYELWTEIDSESTYIEFADRAAGRITQFTDLAAIGVNADGLTVVNMIAPSLDQPEPASVLLRLAQGLALQLQMPAQLIRTYTTDPGETGPGILTVVIGTTDEVAALTGRLVRPGTSFLDDTRGSVLVVSGESWSAISAGVESLTAPLARSADQTLSVLPTAAWHLPDVPLVTGSTRLSLSALGIPTTEFSGRRFRTAFQVAMPADLYAQAYGQASLFLDAAYAPDVLPGSHVDIYVNGEIAATTPIVNQGGGIFRHLEIEVPLRSFSPGINTVEIEAIVPAPADTACLPGSTGSTASRFVLFDTSEFVIPDFGQAAQLPDLSAMAGTGFPLATEDQPVAVVLGRADAETMSAAATFLAKLATLARRPFAISATASGARFGLFIGAASQVPAAIADQAGLSQTALSSWQQSQVAGIVQEAGPATTADTGAVFDRWRDALAGGGGWQGQVSALQDWLRRTFDFSFANMRFGGGQILNFTPADDVGLVLAQGPLATNQPSWTVLTAPTSLALMENTEAIMAPLRWDAIDGQIATYQPLIGVVGNVPLPGADIIVTGQTPGNLRLVATNWLSKNLVVYGGLLLALCVVLAVTTQWLLNSVGRRG